MKSFLSFFKQNLQIFYSMFIIIGTININYSQVGINTSNPQGILDINSNNQGVVFPNVMLTDASIEAPVINPNGTNLAIGTIVYNTNTAGTTPNNVSPGYYYWNGTRWQSFSQISISNTSISTLIDPNILGYIPSYTATASTSAPPSLSIGSGTYNLINTGVNPITGHTYACYAAPAVTTANNISWFDAYNAAKNMGGYLATFTTDAEWQYVETNLLSAPIFDTTRAWIGMCKFSWFAGGALTPDPTMKWITGEQPLHDYSAGGVQAVRLVNWFANGEPNNNFGTEGFCHTYQRNAYTKTYNGYTSTHLWNDLPASTIINVNVTGFIVEFEQ